MSQNRNKLIELLIGNISNVVLHRLLEKAINKPEIAKRYSKETANSFEIARRYREKISPAIGPLPEKDAKFIKKKAANRVKSELQARILKGYENINIDDAEEFVENALKEIKVT